MILHSPLKLQKVRIKKTDIGRMRWQDWFFSDSPGVPASAAAHELFRGFSYVAPMLLNNNLEDQESTATVVEVNIEGGKTFKKRTPVTTSILTVPSFALYLLEYYYLVPIRQG